MDVLEKVYMKRIFVEKKSEQHKKEMSRRENPNLCKDLPVSDDGPPSKSHKMVKTFLDTCLLASLLNWRRKEPDQAKPTRSIVCALGWIYISLHHDIKQWNTSSKRLHVGVFSINMNCHGCVLINVHISNVVHVLLAYPYEH